MSGETRKPHILLGVTGSVATIKLPLLCQELEKLGEVKVIATVAAKHFITEEALPTSVLPLLGDEDDWRAWSKVGDEVMHIKLRRWADVLVIAPLSANTLAKLAHGLSDNLVTCVARAWDFRMPFVIAPAMNTAMWEHPLTARQLEVLSDLGVHMVPPISKKLACGDMGTGALAAPEDIARAVQERLHPTPQNF